VQRYAEFFARHRGLLAVLLFTATALALVGLPKLRFDDRPRAIFTTEDEDFARLESVYRDFGSDDNQALVVLETADWLTPAGAALLRDVADRVARTSGVVDVLGLDDVVVFDGLGRPRSLLPPVEATAEEFARARDAALAHPLVRGRLLSADGGTTVLVARLPEGSLSIAEVEPICDALEALAEEVSERDGVLARVTGIPPIRVEIYEAVRVEQVVFVSIGALICVVVSTLLFRNLPAVFATVVPPVLGTLWSTGYAGLLGIEYDLLGIVIPTLVIVIGFTDSVHLMYDMRRSRRLGLGPLEASCEAIRHLGFPCLLTSFTTAIGIGSLVIGHLEIVRRFGAICAASVALTYAAVIVGLPLVASFLPSLGGDRGAENTGPIGHYERFLERLLVRPRTIVVTGVLGTIVMLWLCTRLVPENRLTEALPDRNAAHDALRHCEAAFGGVLPIHVLVEWDESLEASSPELLRVLQATEDALAAQPPISSPLSLAGLVQALPGSGAALLPLLPPELLRRFVRPELQRALVTANVPDQGTATLAPLHDQLTATLSGMSAQHPGFRFHLTGTDVVARRNVNTMITDLALGLLFATVVIVGVIALEFRSVRLGVASLLPNVFPLAVVGATLAVTGRTMQVISAVLFTILLGLAVDDTIHFMARWRRELEVDGDPRAAAIRASHVVGRAILSTTAVLGCGWGAVVFSSVPTNRLFAVLIVIGLGGALVGDLILLPAMLSLFKVRRSKAKRSAPAP
jgi:predicted RND superfamily exporter protein